MMRFHKYRKTTLTEARLLTEEDAKSRGGIIHTLEGPKALRVGDYLARDAKGEWPIRRTKIERDYERVSEPGGDGFAWYKPLDIREACQMSEAFTIGILTGKPGDYIVKGQDSQWPVDREIFERAYVLVDDVKQ